MSQDSAKRNAAEEAVKLVKNGMSVGLGTGSTAAIAVDLIGEKLSDNFQIIIDRIELEMCTLEY